MDNGDRFKTDKPLIKLFDLRLRWPGALGEEIVEQCERGKLPSYWLHKQCGQTSYLSPYKLQYKEEDGVVDTHIYGTQKGCVFFIEDVERIEQENPDFLEKRADLDESGERIESDIMEDLKLEHCEELDKIKKENDLLKEKIERGESGIDGDTNFNNGIGRKTYQKMLAILFNEIDSAYRDTLKEELNKKIKFSCFSIDPKTLNKLIEEIKVFNRNNRKEN